MAFLIYNNGNTAIKVSEIKNINFIKSKSSDNDLDIIINNNINIGNIPNSDYAKSLIMKNLITNINSDTNMNIINIISSLMEE